MDAPVETKRKKLMSLLPFVRPLLLAYLGLCVLMFLAQRRLVFIPSRGIYQTPGEWGLKYEDVRFRTEDGVQLHAWFVPAEPAKGVILFCHGNAGNISHRVDTIRIFHSLGYSTLMFDYRGYGESKGSPTEAGTYRDVAAAWRHLVQDRGLSADKIVLFGRSLGGPVAAWAAKECKPAALILESTFSSVADMAASVYWFLPVRLLCRFEYATAEYANAAGCPVLVAHSQADDIVPYRLGRQLYDALPQPKQFFDMHGDHNNGFMIMGQAYAAGLKAFLDGQVAGKGG